MAILKLRSKSLYELGVVLMELIGQRELTRAAKSGPVCSVSELHQTLHQSPIVQLRSPQGQEKICGNTDLYTWRHGCQWCAHHGLPPRVISICEQLQIQWAEIERKTGAETKQMDPD